MGDRGRGRDDAMISALMDLPGVRDALPRVEDALRAATVEDDAFLTELAQHLLVAGGKRLRPLLVLASAAAVGGRINDAVIQCAATVELVHIGSLYHDDVMDEAQLRRGVVAVNARFGNSMAILAGDILLARASALALSVDADTARIVASTIAAMCVGQLRELRETYETARGEEAYLRSIDGKTAALCAAACQLGALAGGGSSQDTEKLSQFGRSFGIVFQLADDILDLIEQPQELTSFAWTVDQINRAT